MRGIGDARISAATNLGRQSFPAESLVGVKRAEEGGEDTVLPPSSTALDYDDEHRYRCPS